MPSIAHGIVKGLEARDAAFLRAMQADDDLGMVVRAHIQIEHELREFILARAPAPEYFPDRLEYSRTIQLALLLGLSPTLKNALNALGGLRNRFAHKPDAALSEKEALDFHNGSSDVMQQAIRQMYEHFKNENPDWPRDFQKLAPRDRIVFMVITLRSGIIGDHVLQVHGPDAFNNS